MMKILNKRKGFDIMSKAKLLTKKAAPKKATKTGLKLDLTKIEKRNALFSPPREP